MRKVPALSDGGGALGGLRLRSVSSTAVEVPLRHVPGTSARLPAATPTAHSLEYVDWTDAIAKEPVRITNGCWPMTDRPGSGLDWDAVAVQRHRID
jgi:mandelate racemase